MYYHYTPIIKLVLVLIFIVLIYLSYRKSMIKTMISLILIMMVMIYIRPIKTTSDSVTEKLDNKVEEGVS